MRDLKISTRGALLSSKESTTPSMTPKHLLTTAESKIYCYRFLFLFFPPTSLVWVGLDAYACSATPGRPAEMVEAEAPRSASPARLGRANSPDPGRSASLARFSQVGKKVAASVKLNHAMAEEAKSELRSSQAKGDPNNIKVGLRCRPLSKMELDLGEESVAEFAPPQLCLTNPSPEKSDKPENNLFTYDFVYDSTVSTETVYQVPIQLELEWQTLAAGLPIEPSQTHTHAHLHTQTHTRTPAHARTHTHRARTHTCGQPVIRSVSRYRTPTSGAHGPLMHTRTV